MTAAPLPPASFREIIRLSLPTVGVALLQGGAQTVEIALAGRIGTGAQAAYALVLPLLLLLQMMSTGAMGGGVASSIARAFGAGRAEEARALAWHAVLIGTGMGLAFTVLVLAFGPALFRLVGREGAPVDLAYSYAVWIFAAAVLPWLANTLAAVLRGTGDMATPARILALTWVADAGMSAVLMLGIGPFGGFGLPGAGMAYALAFLGACVAMARVVWRGKLGLSSGGLPPLEPALFRRILSVGIVASVMALMANVTTLLVTGLVAAHGTAALAAYGIGVRLEFLMVPLAFGIGAALVTLVGRRVGAGAWAAARTTAWRGGLLAGGIALAIGGGCAAFAPVVAAAFTADAAVRELAVLYLQIVGPAFGVFGAGMALYFAAQGAGRMSGPFAAALARIGLAAGGGAVLGAGFGLPGVFAAIALGLLAYGAVVGASVRAGVWRERVA
ncbi:MATE family efflux transporter [Roseomonas sp. CCTCC AB2023176]|uniref:MATE family efflux transporter n=1 Tax=Roseomonas sp. CCTCC AB2023176 TaxID=3342640 RepID=UPI0035E13331